MRRVGQVGNLPNGKELDMKLAIAGKGGVGKTALAALLAYLYAGQGQKVSM